MVRERKQGNGRVDRLEEALTSMLQGQAMLQQQLSALATWQAQADARFARIEGILQEVTRVLHEHSRILEEHSRILAALPDAVRERMGFKPPEVKP